MPAVKSIYRVLDIFHLKEKTILGVERPDPEVYWMIGHRIEVLDGENTIKSVQIEGLEISSRAPNQAILVDEHLDIDPSSIAAGRISLHFPDQGLTQTSKGNGRDVR